MKRVIILALCMALVAAGAAGCGAKDETLKVPTLSEHNELVAVVNQHKEVLDNVQSRIDQLKSQLDELSDFVDEFAATHDANVEAYNNALVEIQDKINEIIEFLE